MMLVKLERMNEEGEPEIISYNINKKDNITVLEVIEEIQRHIDPTIAYRFSCRTGLCTTCNILVNHKPALSCLKMAEPDKDGILYLSPLPKGETLKDLVKEVK